jgi:UDP-N-acetylglucosamine 2-epimerase (non-hydrolysing)
MFEVLTYYRPRIDASDVLERLRLEPNGFFVVSAHREENVDDTDSLKALAAVVNAVAENHGLPIVVSTHPRTMKRVEAAAIAFHPMVRLLKPFGFFDYVKLQLSARAVLSDSGTITEESCILGFPALNIRDAHERPEGMEDAAVMMVGLNFERVEQGLHILASQWGGAPRKPCLVSDYAVPNVSQKVVRIIHSYTDYVKRVVWYDGRSEG